LDLNFLVTQAKREICWFPLFSFVQKRERNILKGFIAANIVWEKVARVSVRSQNPQLKSRAKCQCSGMHLPCGKIHGSHVDVPIYACLCGQGQYQLLLCIFASQQEVTLETHSSTLTGWSKSKSYVPNGTEFLPGLNLVPKCIYDLSMRSDSTCQ
jgi:hypothetical protein